MEREGIEHMRDSFILYCEYQQHLKLLEPSEQGNLLMALFDYVGKGIEPDLDGMTSVAFSFIRSQIDRDCEKYKKTIEARKEAGRKGGLTKQSKANEANANIAKQNEANQANATFAKQSEANQAVYVNDNVYVNDKKEKESTKKKRFVPPTLENVSGYCQEKGLSVDAQRFIDFYESKGWMVGKNKMKDWKAACRNWNRSEKKPVVTKANNMTARSYDMDSLEEKLLNAN